MSQGAVAQGVGAISAVPARVLTDKRLAGLAAQGSQAAFSEIFRRYHQPLYAYAKSILASDDDARDAVQATMVKLLDSLPGEQREILLKPWLFRIAHNEAISVIRGRKDSPTDDVDLAVTTDDADSRIRTRELLSDLSGLPDRQRSAVVLRELSGLSHKEIALALGTSTAAAKQAVYEGRLALQEMEAGREMECSTARESISEQDRRILRGRKIRAHLRNCTDCRDFAATIGDRRTGLAALSPLPLGASQQMLAAILGSGAGPAGGLGILGVAGAAKVLGGTGAAQFAAAVVVATGAGVGVNAVVNTSGATGEPGASEAAITATSGAPASAPGGSGSTVAGPAGDGTDNESASGNGNSESNGKRDAIATTGNGGGGSTGGDGGSPDGGGSTGGGKPGSGGNAGGGKPSSPPGHDVAGPNKPQDPGNAGNNPSGKTPPGLGKEPGKPSGPPPGQVPKLEVPDLPSPPGQENGKGKGKGP